MDDINFTLSNKGILKISFEAVLKMKSYSQNQNHNLEAGGVLIGRFIKDSKDIVVDKITAPMLNDKRTRNTFVRGVKMHQRVIDSEWVKSNGTLHYLGEWHTHPENYPTPSSIDLKNWKAILKTYTYTSRYLYFVIVGIKEIRIWEGDRKTLEIKKL